MDDDVIKRMGAVAALRREYPAMPMFKELREEWAVKTEGYRKAQEVILRLPSADRPQGEWTESALRSDIHRYECSNCKAHHMERYNYCPSCGARMVNFTEDDGFCHFGYSKEG